MDVDHGRRGGSTFLARTDTASARRPTARHDSGLWSAATVRMGLVVLVGTTMAACSSTSGPDRTQARRASTDTTSAAARDSVVVRNSEWRPGMDEAEALLEGTLSVRAGCLVLGDAGQVSEVLWPQGWTASVDGRGQVQVRRADGSIAVAFGERLSANGSARPDRGCQGVAVVSVTDDLRSR